MHPDVLAILEQVKGTADFGYVEFPDINSKNYLGENALHIVVRWGDYEAAKLLIAHGIDVNQKGEEDYTPLHYACSYGRKEIAELLLENGADPFARTAGYLPFTVARLGQHGEVCDLIRAYTSKQTRREMNGNDKHLQALSESIERLEKQIEENCGSEVKRSD